VTAGELLAEAGPTVRSVAARSATAAPLTPDRSTGQTWARQELGNPAYARERPGLLRRGWDWLLGRVDQLAGGHGAGPGRILAVVVLAALVVVVVIVVARRGARLRVARATREFAVLSGTSRSGAEHRVLADQARAEGRYADAVRESMRAIARRLDERGLLDPRPGRTADELAREAGTVLAGVGDELRRGATVFDDVWYGEVTASRQDAELLMALDERVEAARPGLGSAASTAWVSVG
jgi:hypothetical protein